MHSLARPLANLQQNPGSNSTNHDALQVQHQQIIALLAAQSDHEAHEISDKAEASQMMESLQAELDRAQLGGNVRMRSSCLRLMRQLNRTHGVLPSSMFLNGLTCESQHPVTGGGFSDVWIGRLEDRRVCVKVLRFFLRSTDREGLLKSLSKEVLLWRQLNHPNILPFLGVDKTLFSPSFSIVSPWMDNGDLISYSRKSSLGLNAKLHHMNQIAEGLVYLHELDPPVVHGDLKGANVLISDDHVCCLADFGLSILDTQSNNPTHTSTIQGSLRWLAPEYINPSNKPTEMSLTPRDIYAFGCTVFELITEQPPFAHHNQDISVAIDVLNGVRPILPVDIQVSNEATFQTIQVVLSRCWSEGFKARPSAREVLDLIRDLSSVLEKSPKLAPTILIPPLESASIPVTLNPSSLPRPSGETTSQLPADVQTVKSKGAREFDTVESGSRAQSSTEEPVTKDFASTTSSQTKAKWAALPFELQSGFIQQGDPDGVDPQHQPQVSKRRRDVFEPPIPYGEFVDDGDSGIRNKRLKLLESTSQRKRMSLLLPEDKSSLTNSVPKSSISTKDAGASPGRLNRFSLSDDRDRERLSNSIGKAFEGSGSFQVPMSSSLTSPIPSSASALSPSSLGPSTRFLRRRQYSASPGAIDLPPSLPYVNGGCWTCRIRRKTCDKEHEGNSCGTCIRVGIECLGWGPNRPEWMRDKQAVDQYKADIKAKVARAGLIRGSSRRMLPHATPDEFSTSDSQVDLATNHRPVQVTTSPAGLPLQDAWRRYAVGEDEGSGMFVHKPAWSPIPYMAPRRNSEHPYDMGFEEPLPTPPSPRRPSGRSSRRRKVHRDYMVQMQLAQEQTEIGGDRPEGGLKWDDSGLLYALDGYRRRQMHH